MKIAISEKKDALIASAILALVFYGFVMCFATNTPYGDDYVAVFEFLEQYSVESDWSETWGLLFSLHNEHRIFLTRIIVLGTYSLFGEVNFALLTLIANLSLLCSLYLLFKLLSELKNPWLLPILTCFLLQPAGHYLIFYSMSAIQAYFGLLLSLLFIYFLTKNKTWPSVFSYLAGCLTTGAAVFLPILGVWEYLTRSKSRTAVIVVVLAPLVTTLYIHDYSFFSDTSDFSLLRSLVMFLHLTGSVVNFYLLENTLTFFVGGVILVMSLYTLGQYRRRYPMVCVVIVYLLMTMLIIALRRAGIDDATAFAASQDGRYRLYSCLLFAIHVAMLPEVVSSTKCRAVWINATAVFGVLFFVFSFICHAPVARLYSDWRQAGIVAWSKDQRRTSGLTTIMVPREYGARLLSDAKSKGVYEPATEQGYFPIVTFIGRLLE